MKKTIGILGGMGPAATADFYRRIVDITIAEKDQDHLHVLIESNPYIPDRTAYLQGQGPDPLPMLIEMAHRLLQAGAHFLVIACNTANIFAPAISAAVPVPIFCWVDEVVSTLKQQQPHLHRLGLLATDGTLNSGIYQQACIQHNIQAIIPQPRIQTQVKEAIYGSRGIKAGGVHSEMVQIRLAAAEKHLQEKGAEAILLACTELSLYVTHHAQEWSVPTVDAAQIVAERVVLLAGGQIRERHYL